jgi:hypothetical protein
MRSLTWQLESQLLLLAPDILEGLDRKKKQKLLSDEEKRKQEGDM